MYPAVHLRCLLYVQSQRSALMGDVKIDLKSKERALLFLEKCPSARIDDTDPESIILEAPGDLLFIRPSETESYVLVFRLLNNKAARDWCKKTVLGKVDGDKPDVRLKLKWKEDELDRKLNLETSIFPPPMSEVSPLLSPRSAPLPLTLKKNGYRRASPSWFERSDYNSPPLRSAPLSSRFPVESPPSPAQRPSSLGRANGFPFRPPPSRPPRPPSPALSLLDDFASLPTPSTLRTLPISLSSSPRIPQFPVESRSSPSRRQSSPATANRFAFRPPSPPPQCPNSPIRKPLSSLDNFKRLPSTPSTIQSSASPSPQTPRFPVERPPSPAWRQWSLKRAKPFPTRPPSPARRPLSPLDNFENPPSTPSTSWRAVSPSPRIPRFLLPDFYYARRRSSRRANRSLSGFYRLGLNVILPHHYYHYRSVFGHEDAPTLQALHRSLNVPIRFHGGLNRLLLRYEIIGILSA
ncbi:hypothetical protein V8E51_014540 [Hyaloscypha variabilis]